MLRRNGENCEHAVPNYPGLLTPSELKAYHVGISSVAKQVFQFNERAAITFELENQIAEIAEQATALATHDSPTLTVIEAEGLPKEVWQINHTLFKSPRCELLLCSRDAEGEKRFAVVERFSPDSPYARPRGEADLHMSGHDVSDLLQGYVSSWRDVLDAMREDIETTVAKNLLARFPDLDSSRVVKAISACCDAKVSPDSAQMARRNGEYRRYKVPGFLGLLTASEHEAYIDVRAALLSLKNKEAIFPSIETVISHWEKLAARLAGNNDSKYIRSIIREMDEKAWQVYEIFSKPDLESDTLFCSREERGQREFAVVETMDSTQEMTSFGEIQIHGIGINASQVLREFFRREQESLQWSRNHLEETIGDRLREKLSPGGRTRVLKAIAALYDKEKFTAEEETHVQNVPAQKSNETRRGIRIC
jgi:hypothetical protein